MSTIKETIEDWLETDKTGNLIADQFEEIIIREGMEEDSLTPQVYVFVSDHKTGFTNSILIEADGVAYWLEDQYRYVTKKNDNVNHPNHYCQNGLESIDVIKAFTSDLKGEAAFCAGNAIKYILRFHHKNGKEDLEKAKWYINRLEEVLYSDADDSE